MFYLVCNSIEERSALIQHLKTENILSVFHYLSLHKSPYYTSQYEGPELEYTDLYTDCLVRLPLFYELTESDIFSITDVIHSFYKDRI
ncbi:dTDP-4-amino-4,6-dideoxygalactose transaminase [compost metagenome]